MHGPPLFHCVGITPLTASSALSAPEVGVGCGCRVRLVAHVAIVGFRWPLLTITTPSGGGSNGRDEQFKSCPARSTHSLHRTEAGARIATQEKQA